MSLIPDPEELEQWRGFLERRFIAAAQTREDYMTAAGKAHEGAVAWITNDTKEKGSFRWVCDLFGLEPDAVRRAMKERGKEGLDALL